jgi:hypothetical protein
MEKWEEPEALDTEDGWLTVSEMPAPMPLKVPKCEIYDRSNFHYFYTIKSLREGDFGVKTKKCKNV